jgi:hypothetical protein
MVWCGRKNALLAIQMALPSCSDSQLPLTPRLASRYICLDGRGCLHRPPSLAPTLCFPGCSRRAFRVCGWWVGDDEGPENTAAWRRRRGRKQLLGLFVPSCRGLRCQWVDPLAGPLASLEGEGPTAHQAVVLSMGVPTIRQLQITKATQSPGDRHLARVDPGTKGHTAGRNILSAAADHNGDGGGA